MDSWQAWVAVYAAIVATGALALEVRRWVEGRPRLLVTAAPGMTVHGMLGHEDGPYVFVTVTNRGSTPTTVTHLVAHEYANWWKRWRRSACATYYITDPTLPGSSIGQMPSVLEPGRQWQAAFDEDAKAREWLDSGRFYVAIYATHANAPALTRLRRTTVEAASPKERGAATA